MTSSQKLPGIHALRTVAAVTVFLLHIINMTANWVQPVVDATRFMHFGVPLFFALSAFSLMYSTKPYQGSPGWVRRFYLKRYFRIAPLYYVMMIVDVVLTCTMTLHRVVPQQPWPEFKDVLLNLVFLFELHPSLSHTLVLIGWSVGVEMLFYLVFPLFVLSVRGLFSAAACVALSIAVGELARPYLDQYPIALGLTAAYYHVLTNLRYFAFGILAFFAFRALQRTSLATAPKNSPRALSFHVVCAAAAAALMAVLALYEQQLANLHHADMSVWGLLFAVLCVWVTVRPLRVLNWAPLQYLGERSYSLYLVHLPLLLLMTTFTGWVFARATPVVGDMAAVFVTIAATYAPIIMISALTYRFIERPGMDLGKRIERIAVRASTTPETRTASPSTEV